MSEYHFRVDQGGVTVAEAYSFNRDRARAEAAHYQMMFGQDGPVEVFERKRSGRSFSRWVPADLAP